MPIRQTLSMTFSASPSGYPGLFYLDMGSVLFQKNRPGYRRLKKLGPLFFPGTRGTVSMAHHAPVFPKKYRRGILAQKIRGVPIIL